MKVYTMFRQPYDDSYDSSFYVTPVGYELDSDPDKQMQNALEASATEQAHARETDINVILARYSQTGVLPQSSATPFYGDLTDLPSFLDAQIIVATANESFAQLPSEVRERFANDPRKFLAFMDDPNNAPEAARLGLTVRSSGVADTQPEAGEKSSETPPAA